MNNQINNKLYIVTHKALTTGQQIAQVAHATAAFAQHRPDAFTNWYKNSQFIIVLAVPSLHELEKLSAKLTNSQIDTVVFREPDMDDQLTAFAVNPMDYAVASRMLSNIPLAGKT